jgi:hydrogenase maturation protease
MNEWEWQLLEDKPALESVNIRGVEIKRYDRVVLHPKPGADMMDLAMAGKIAIVEAIEQDYEGQIQFAVVIEDDPGRDLGFLRQPGHRFFFRMEEIELA